MESAMELLFEICCKKLTVPHNNPVISNYRAILKKGMTKENRKYLLRVEDRYSLFVEEMARQAFEMGLRLGMSLYADKSE